MFGLLKNKLTGFIKNLVGKEEGKEAEPRQPAPETKPPAQAPERLIETHPVEALKEEAQPEIKKPQHEEKEQPAIEKKREEAQRHAAKEHRHEPSHIPKEEKTEQPKPVLEKKQEAKEPKPDAEKRQETKEKPQHTAVPASEKPSPTVAPSEHKKSILGSIFGAKKEEPKPDVKKEAQAQQEQARHDAKTFAHVRTEAPKAAVKAETRAEPKAEVMTEITKPQIKQEAKPVPSKPETKEISRLETRPAQAAAPHVEHDLSGVGKKAASERRGMAPKIGIGTAIKSFFSSEITIGEAEVNDLLEELELSLLEADVAYDVSLDVAQQLRGRLVGMKVPKGEVEKRTKDAIREILESVMDSDRKFDFLSRVKSMERPVKILFVGPNGAGKTTTIAKIARKLMDNGLSVVFSASDTFRAAAIEQTEVHAERLGVKVIKSKYGADPASVAFDAVNHARSNSIDVVLIDSAGRQDTNANLLSELKKINRVAKPDIKLYVGESISGNALLEQIKAFNEAIGIDGAILTKIDCDAKGGTAISISKSTGIPVLFLGIGQRYEDLIPFDAHRIAQEIMN